MSRRSAVSWQLFGTATHVLVEGRLQLSLLLLQLEDGTSQGTVLALQTTELLRKIHVHINHKDKIICAFSVSLRITGPLSEETTKVMQIRRTKSQWAIGGGWLQSPASDGPPWTSQWCEVMLFAGCEPKLASCYGLLLSYCGDHYSDVTWASALMFDILACSNMGCRCLIN